MSDSGTREYSYSSSCYTLLIQYVYLEAINVLLKWWPQTTNELMKMAKNNTSRLETDQELEKDDNLKLKLKPLLFPRAAVVHLNFRAGSTFPVPVCTVPSCMDMNGRCSKVDGVRLYASYMLNLLLLKGQRCVFLYHVSFIAIFQ